MLTIAEASGSTTFVASSRPPRPTSSTATSTRARAKCQRAAAVTASKNVGCAASVPRFTRAAAASRTAITARANAASVISRPPTVIRSLIRTR